jgi:cytochrome c biogenesis protein ResB
MQVQHLHDMGTVFIGAGVAYGGLSGFKGTAMVPEGGDFAFSQVLLPKSPIARLPESADSILHVNSFDVRYRDDGSVEQFLSDLSVFDWQGRERLRKTISVNDPLRYQVRCPAALRTHGSNPRRAVVLSSLHASSTSPGSSIVCCCPCINDSGP